MSPGVSHYDCGMAETTPAEGTTTGTTRVKRGMAEMLKGGVIMDVVTPEQAKIAEDAGACAVMALERVPADIRRDGEEIALAPGTTFVELMPKDEGGATFER